jgi:hypothetical protein
VLDQVPVKVPDLLLGHLDLFQCRGNLLEGQVAALPALGDQGAELVGVLKPGIALELSRGARATGFLPGGCDTIVPDE